MNAVRNVQHDVQDKHVRARVVAQQNVHLNSLSPVIPRVLWAAVFIIVHGDGGDFVHKVGLRQLAVCASHADFCDTGGTRHMCAAVRLPDAGEKAARPIKVGDVEGACMRACGALLCTGACVPRL